MSIILGVKRLHNGVTSVVRISQKKLKMTFSYYFFMCRWLTGDVVDNEARPDRLGLVFSKRAHISRFG
jgi:hypothetical protein